MKITFTVNGKQRTVEAGPLRRLLDILRDDLKLKGTKEGCGEGECGACSVIMNGRVVLSCLVPALQLPGAEVVTIEGLGTETAPHPIQKAFMEEGAVQCGFCTPGMIMAARELLERTSHPTRAEIRTALAGNLCRCTGYDKIFRAVEKAAYSKK
jgi:aerobic-type carbon monoxide dehydrogenase small subunit (CoxS/CutS family)